MRIDIFDSEELDDQTFDWKDIRQLRSPRSLNALDIGGDPSRHAVVRPAHRSPKNGGGRMTIEVAHGLNLPNRLRQNVLD